MSYYHKEAIYNNRRYCGIELRCALYFSGLCRFSLVTSIYRWHPRQQRFPSCLVAVSQNGEKFPLALINGIYTGSVSNVIGVMTL